MKPLLFLSFTFLFIYTATAQTLKVMSYNIHHGTDTAEVDRLAEMAKFIKESGADLIGLQEVDSVCRRTNNVDQMKVLGELTGMHYAFVRHMAYQGGAYGQGILSKYPISNTQNHRITLLKKDGAKDSRALLSVLVNTGKKKVVFASVHFALDAESRMIQSDETINYLKNKDYPVILTGDLNAEPNQKEIINLEKYFAKTDHRNLLAFPVAQPKKKIDYIFVDANSLQKVSKLKVFKNNMLSDHLPIICTVELKD